MLNIVNTAEAGKATLALEGRLDTVTSPELEAELKGILDGASELTLDFEKLEYVSSAGLRVLLSAQKAINKKNGIMKIVHVNDVISEGCEVTGFSEILTIE